MNYSPVYARSTVVRNSCVYLRPVSHTHTRTHLSISTFLCLGFWDSCWSVFAGQHDLEEERGDESPSGDIIVCVRVCARACVCVCVCVWWKGVFVAR